MSAQAVLEAVRDGALGAVLCLPLCVLGAWVMAAIEDHLDRVRELEERLERFERKAG